MDFSKKKFNFNPIIRSSNMLRRSEKLVGCVCIIGLVLLICNQSPSVASHFSEDKKSISSSVAAAPPSSISDATSKQQKIVPIPLASSSLSNDDSSSNKLSGSDSNIENHQETQENSRSDKKSAADVASSASSSSRTSQVQPIAGSEKDSSSNSASASAHSSLDLSANDEYVQIKPEEIGINDDEKDLFESFLPQANSADSSSSSQTYPNSRTAEHKSADDELNAHLAQDSLSSQESRSYGISSPSSSNDNQPSPRAAYSPNNSNRYQPSPAHHNSYPVAQAAGPAAPKGSARQHRSPQQAYGPPQSSLSAASAYHHQAIKNVKDKFVGSLLNHHASPSYIGTPSAQPNLAYANLNQHNLPRHLPRGAAAGYAAFREFVRARANKYKPAHAPGYLGPPMESAKGYAKPANGYSTSAAGASSQQAYRPQQQQYETTPAHQQGAPAAAYGQAGPAPAAYGQAAPAATPAAYGQAAYGQPGPAAAAGYGQAGTYVSAGPSVYGPSIGPALPPLAPPVPETSGYGQEPSYNSDATGYSGKPQPAIPAAAPNAYQQQTHQEHQPTGYYQQQQQPEKQPSSNKYTNKVTVAQAYIPHMAPPAAIPYGAANPAAAYGHQQQYDGSAAAGNGYESGTAAAAPTANQYQQQQPAAYTNAILSKLYGGDSAVASAAGKPEYSKDYGMVIHYPQATVYTEPMTIDQLNKLTGSGISHVLEQVQQNLASGYREAGSTIRANDVHHLGHGVTISSKEYLAPDKTGQYVPTTAALVSTSAMYPSYKSPPAPAGYGNQQQHHQQQQHQHHQQQGYKAGSDLGAGYERVKQAVSNSFSKYTKNAGQDSYSSSSSSTSSPSSPSDSRYKEIMAISNLIGAELKALYKGEPQHQQKQPGQSHQNKRQPSYNHQAQHHHGKHGRSPHSATSGGAYRPHGPHGQPGYPPKRGHSNRRPHSHRPPHHQQGPNQYGPPPAGYQQHKPSNNNHPKGNQQVSPYKHQQQQHDQQYGPKPGPYQNQKPEGHQQQGAHSYGQEKHNQQKQQYQQQGGNGYGNNNKKQHQYGKQELQQYAALEKQMVQLLQDLRNGDDQYSTQNKPQSISQGYPHKVIQKYNNNNHKAGQKGYQEAPAPTLSAYAAHDGIEYQQGPNDQIGEISELIENLKGALESSAKPNEEHNQQQQPKQNYQAQGAQYQSQQHEQQSNQYQQQQSPYKQQGPKPEDARYIANALAQPPSYAVQVPVAAAPVPAPEVGVAIPIVEHGSYGKLQEQVSYPAEVSKYQQNLPIQPHQRYQQYDQHQQQPAIIAPQHEQPQAPAAQVTSYTHITPLHQLSVESPAQQAYQVPAANDQQLQQQQAIDIKYQQQAVSAGHLGAPVPQSAYVPMPSVVSNPIQGDNIPYAPVLGQQQEPSSSAYDQQQHQLPQQTAYQAPIQFEPTHQAAPALNQGYQQQSGAYSGDQQHQQQANQDQYHQQQQQPQQPQQQSHSNEQLSIINHLIPVVHHQQQPAQQQQYESQPAQSQYQTQSDSHHHQQQQHNSYQQQQQPAEVPSHTRISTNQIAISAPTEADFQNAQPLSSLVNSLPTEYQDLLRQPHPTAQLVDAAAHPTVAEASSAQSSQDNYQSASSQVHVRTPSPSASSSSSSSVSEAIKDKPAPIASASQLDKQQSVTTTT